jgi:hypothetical protein
LQQSLRKLAEAEKVPEKVTEVYFGGTFREPIVRVAEDTAAALKADTAYTRRLALLREGQSFESFVLHELVQTGIETDVPHVSPDYLTISELWRFCSDLWPIEPLSIAAAGPL